MPALVAVVWIRVEGLPLFDRTWLSRRARWMQAGWLQGLANRLAGIEHALSTSTADGKAEMR